MGLVNRVLAGDELDGFVDDYTGTTERNAPLTIKACKQIVAESITAERCRYYAAKGNPYRLILCQNCSYLPAVYVSVRKLSTILAPCSFHFIPE